MATILAIGSIGFWILLSVAVILIITALEKESFGGASATFIGAIILIACLGSGKDLRGVGEWIIANPGTSSLVILGYALLGVIWSFIKWYMYLVDIRMQRGTNKVAADKDKNIARYNKSTIMSWMCYWPLSMLWTLINNPIKRFFNYIFESISGSYQRLADRVLKQD